MYKLLSNYYGGEAGFLYFKLFKFHVLCASGRESPVLKVQIKKAKRARKVGIVVEKITFLRKKYGNGK